MNAYSDRAALRELRAAIQRSRESNAILTLDSIGALLDDPAALGLLRKAQIQVRANDLPHLTEDHLQVLEEAAIAKRRYHGAQIKEGLDRARRRGVRLGNPRLSEMHAKGELTHLPRARARAATTNRDKAQAFAVGLKDTVSKLVSRNPTITYRELADHLNQEGILTRRRAQWNPGTAYRLCARLGLARPSTADMQRDSPWGEFS